MFYDSLEENVITAMDGSDNGLMLCLPYILQDFWELGFISDEIVDIIKEYKTDYTNINVLDLDSGKGTVSNKIAAELKCICFGIDAINDFVIYSNNKSKEYSVNDICTFEKNDIENVLGSLGKFDIIILGAINTVFKDFYNTLLQLVSHLKKDGLIIINDVYLKDDCEKKYPNILKMKEIKNQINDTGMELVKIIETHKVFEEYKKENENIEKICMELIAKYNENKEMLFNYIEKQKIEHDLFKIEYGLIKNEIHSAIFVIKDGVNK